MSTSFKLLTNILSAAMLLLATMAVSSAQQNFYDGFETTSGVIYTVSEDGSRIALDEDSAGFEIVPSSRLRGTNGRAIRPQDLAPGQAVEIQYRTYTIGKSRMEHHQIADLRLVN